MSWGWKITLLYSSFVVMILTFVILSTTKNYDLVTPEYYEAEVRYQSQLDRVNRANALETPMQISYQAQDRQILIAYPEGHAAPQGTVTLYRPANARMDQTFPVTPSASLNQVIPTEKMVPGLWKVQVSWEVAGVEYFKEQAVVI